MSTDQVLAAIGAAAATWESAVPSVRFEFHGLTDRPVIPVVGINEIGWGAVDGSALTVTDSPDSMWFATAQTIINLYPAEFFYGCAQEDDSCTEVRQDTVRDWNAAAPLRQARLSLGCNPEALDLQDTMTLEFGHWLGLADLTGSSDESLSMSSDVTPSTPCGVLRQKSTLGLGDILGARALYPCACPLPYIFEP